MRVVAVADLHGHLPELEPCDLLVVAGDSGLRGRADKQRAWLDSEFRSWLEAREAGAIVGIAGNCDLAAAEDPELMRSLPWTYLENESADVLGLRVHGSPLALPFGNWPFTAPEDELEPAWAAIPDETQLHVVHGPPYGLGDQVYSGAHVGSRSLRARVEELRNLRVLVTGHVHEGYGRGRIGAVEWVNAAILEDWRPENPPVALELQVERSAPAGP